MAGGCSSSFFRPSYACCKICGCCAHWLGVSLFPTVQLCTYISSIDPYGDHLLGCSYGPLCNCRHDVLAFISCHWTILVFWANREYLGIISLGLVIFTILTSVKAIRLSLMFLFEMHSLLQLFLRRQFLLGLLGRLSRINIMRIMLLLLDCFILWLRRHLECGLLLQLKP